MFSTYRRKDDNMATDTIDDTRRKHETTIKRIEMTTTSARLQTLQNGPNSLH